MNKLFWQWVEEHIGDNPSKLRLSAKPRSDFDVAAAITQIECRQRFGKKLADTLGRFPHFFFPSTLAGEQATSDLLAAYHERILADGGGGCSGGDGGGGCNGGGCSVVDLTCGLGIDAFHLARKVGRVLACDRNSAIIEALDYNKVGLGLNNIETVSGDCRDMVKELSGDVAFIDPARRAADGSRVFGLRDCEPDLTAMYGDIAARFGRLIVKASPMLDIAQTIAELPDTTDIYILGTKTECKELVALVDFRQTGSHPVPVVHAVTLWPDGKTVEIAFTRSDEAEAPATPERVSLPSKGDILYEPYPATMKAAPFRLLASRYGLSKFHPNTHLYFGPADRPAEDFPGELFEIVDVVEWKSKNIKRLKSVYPNAMVTVRNFGMSAEALRSKLGIKEGGTTRLRIFGIGLGTDHTDRILVVAR